MRKKRLLLVYPENPVTFWKFDIALRIAGLKSAFPPWGLLTIAGDIPENDYQIRLVDMNCSTLKDRHLQWADVVITSAMIIHRRSLEHIIQRATTLGKPVLAGGPYPTHYHDQIPGDATFFRGESEAGFLDVLEEMLLPGYQPVRRDINREGVFAPIQKSPLPRLDLIHMKYYTSMIVQVTRGCPNKCTFCDIPGLFGRDTRLKKPGQVLRELAHLYRFGWRSNVMFADDNLTGNQHAVMPILEEVIRWQEQRRYPFKLFTQVSLDMCENPPLMELMYRAGFNQVFIGLESPDAGALKFMGAQKNLRGPGKAASMLSKVQTLQRKYFQVQAGFILGLDPDPSNIAQVMKKFIRDSNIGTAMIGTLGVMRRTPDWMRFKKQNRLKEDVVYSGGSGILSTELNYEPRRANGDKRSVKDVLRDQAEVVCHTYSPAEYFGRIRRYFRELERRSLHRFSFNRKELMAFFKSLYIQGIRSYYRTEYWKFLWDIVRHKPGLLAHAVTEAIKGHHFILRTQQAVQTVDFRNFLDTSLAQLQELKAEALNTDTLERKRRAALEQLEQLRRDCRKQAAVLHRKLHQDFRLEVAREYDKFLETLQEIAQSLTALQPSLAG